jgi:hypothetical protein
MIDALNNSAQRLMSASDHSLIDIPHVACRLTPELPDLLASSRALFSQALLQSSEFPNVGLLDRKAGPSLLGGAVFQRDERTCPVAFVQFGSGSRSRA